MLSGHNLSLLQVDSGLGFDASKLKTRVLLPGSIPGSIAPLQGSPTPSSPGNPPPQLCLQEPKIPIRKRTTRARTDPAMREVIPGGWQSPSLFSQTQTSPCNSLVIHPPPPRPLQPVTALLFNQILCFPSLQEPEPFFYYILIDQALASRCQHRPGASFPIPTQRAVG